VTTTKDVIDPEFFWHDIGVVTVSEVEDPCQMLVVDWRANPDKGWDVVDEAVVGFGVARKVARKIASNYTSEEHS